MSNVVGSTIAREADGGVYQHVGPEIGVASTKAFTSQLLLGAMLALYVARMRDMNFSDGVEYVQALKGAPDLVRKALEQAPHIQEIAKRYAYYHDFLFLGRLSLFPVALEGALKLKEISYIHAEGYPAAEMKHGPIALISEQCPSVFLVPSGEMFNKVVSSMQEIKARKGKIIAIATENCELPAGLADEVITIPECHEAVLPIIATVPVQLLSYYIAVELKRDVDKPRQSGQIGDRRVTMQVTPSREAFLPLSKKGNVIPVYTDLLADLETPVSAFAKLRGNQPAFLLESVEGGENVSRFSFIGCNPRKIISAPAGATDPLKTLQEELAGYKPVDVPGLPPFTGGAVGYLRYEVIHSVEKTVPLAKQDELGVPMMWFMLCDSVLAFDRAHQTLRLIVNAHIGTDAGAAYDAACTELKRMKDALAQPAPLTSSALADSGPVKVPAGNFTKDAFEAMVEGTKEYIRAGDIFQIVLSQRFSREFNRTPLDLYRALRTVNPSPYMFLLDTGDFALVGASPEVHVRLTDRKVEIRPIAGTRPRGKTTVPRTWPSKRNC